MNIGKAIKILRIEKDIDQRSLSVSCGYDKSYISLLESGIREPSFKTLLKISGALSVKPSELLSKAESYEDK